MPQVVIPAALAAVGSYASGATILSLTALQTAGVVFAANLAIGALTALTSPDAEKPEIPSFQPLSSRGQARTQQIRQAITPRRLLVGEARISGPLVFAESTSNNKYLHLVIALGEGPFTAIGEVWLNDEPIFDDDLDGSGNVTAGKFADKVRIKKHLGADAQTADSDLTGETSAISSFRLRGIAYLYVRLEFDQDLFPTSIPNVSAWCRGPAVTDTRDASSKWTPNAALQIRDWMLDTETGLGVTSSEIDDTVIDSSANTCDEIVAVAAGVSHTVATVQVSDDALDLNGDVLELQTGDRVDVTSTGSVPSGLGTDMFVIVKRRKSTSDKDLQVQLASTLADAYAGTAATISDAGSGTITVEKTGEPRYTANGLIDTDAKPNQILADLLSAMGGHAVYVGGTWKVEPGHYVAPTVTLDEDHLRSTLGVTTKHSRRERFNRVKGVYVSPLNGGQPSDYPPVTSASYLSEDSGVESWRDLELPFTSRPHTAQRLAKRLLERHRRQITVAADFSLHAMQLRVGDTVALDNDRMGWSAKKFMVSEHRLTLVNGAELAVHMVLREIDSSVDSWSSGEETAVSPDPTTTLPDPFDVSAPTSLAVTTETVFTDGGDQLGYIVFSWATHGDAYVVNGGHFEGQFKKSSDSTWSETWSVEGDKTSTRIGPLEQNVNYDVRVRARNYLGVRSTYSSLTGFTLGASGSGATNQLDYEEFSDPVTLSIDYGSFGASIDRQFDYGEFV